MTLHASEPRSIRVMLVIAALSAAPAIVGCGASAERPSTASASTATVGGEAPADGALARMEALETEAARRERRIRELESRLALADAEVQELRDEADAREAEEARPVIRIGEAPRTTRVAQVEEEEAPAEEPVAVDDGPRPVLRLYGPPELPQLPYAPAPVASGMAMPAAMPSSMPQYLPSPPMVGGLGPLPVVAPPGVRSMVPPIPDQPLAVLPAPPAPMLAASAPAPRRPADDPAVREYQLALGHVAARRFDEALAGLTGFLRAHPQHPYADNAMYWRGEVLYMRRDYAGAERELAEMVRRFPHGNKVADALLRLGFCRQRQGDLEGARTYFRRVRTEHPGTVAARLASREDT
ncbi:MAG: tol-pal system protein YbgF [Sandaracinus sp.]